MTTWREIVKPQLLIDEGMRTHPYKDSVGFITIGVGRNLDTVGLRPDEIDLMLENDIDAAVAVARRLLPNFEDLTEERKAVMVNMAFNMGEKVLATFTNTLAAIRESRFDDAARLMLDSRWSVQVGARAQRLAEAMKGEVQA